MAVLLFIELSAKSQPEIKKKIFNATVNEPENCINLLILIFTKAEDVISKLALCLLSEVAASKIAGKHVKW